MNLMTFCLLIAATTYVPNDAERARWTMQDMQSWRIVMAAYAQDHDGKYPQVKTIEELRAVAEPTYIAHAPMTDAWGNAYRLVPDANGALRVISAGADGKFEDATWSAGGELKSFDDDAVATPGRGWLFRHWSLK